MRSRGQSRSATSWSPIAGPRRRRRESRRCLSRGSCRRPRPTSPVTVSLTSSQATSGRTRNHAAIALSPFRSCDARPREDESDRADCGSRTLEIGECTSGEPDSGCPVGTAARTRLHKRATRCDSRQEHKRTERSNAQLRSRPCAGADRRARTWAHESGQALRVIDVLAPGTGRFLRAAGVDSAR